MTQPNMVIVHSNKAISKTQLLVSYTTVT